MLLYKLVSPPEELSGTGPARMYRRPVVHLVSKFEDPPPAFSLHTRCELGLRALRIMRPHMTRARVQGWISGFGAPADPWPSLVE